MIVLFLRDHLMALAFDQHNGGDQKDNQGDSSQNNDRKKTRVTCTR